MHMKLTGHPDDLNFTPAQMTLLTLGFVAFQLFSVDPTQLKVGDRPFPIAGPAGLASKLQLIWPGLHSTCQWPSAPFDAQEFDEVLTWVAPLPMGG